MRITSILILVVTSALWCQEPTAGKDLLQQRVSELKVSVAAKQAKLKKYQRTTG